MGLQHAGNISQIGCHAKASWYVVECMTATKKNGLAII